MKMENKIKPAEVREIVSKPGFMPSYEYKTTDKKEILYLVLGLPIEDVRIKDYKSIRKPVGDEKHYFSYWKMSEYSLVLFDTEKRPCVIMSKDSVAFKTFIQALIEVKEKRKVDKRMRMFPKLYSVKFANRDSKAGHSYVMTESVSEYVVDEVPLSTNTFYEDIGGE